MDNRPIGVFDSGVGGMTVLKELMNIMPNESFVYLGDTKRFPYGSKSKETIIELTKNGIEFLIKKNVKLIVIACGTATSQALDEVKSLYDIPIIGVLEPTVDYLKSTNKKEIGVIATAGTINSKGFDNCIMKKIPDAKVQAIPCPLLAPMVEEGWYDNDIARLAIKEYLKPLGKVEALILGCTHYPLLSSVIKEQIGEDVELINIGTHVAREVKNILEINKMFSENTKICNHNILQCNNLNISYGNSLNKNSSEIENNLQNYLCIYLTETEHKFNEIASKLLGKKVEATLVKEETELYTNL